MDASSVTADHRWFLLIVGLSVSDQVLGGVLPKGGFTYLVIGVSMVGLVRGILKLAVRRRVLPYIVAMIAFTGWGWLSLFWTESPSYGLFKMEYFTIRCALPFVALQLLRYRESGLILSSVIVVTAVAGALRFLLRPVMLEVGRYSTGSNPIWFGRLMGMGCLGALNWFIWDFNLTSKFNLSKYLVILCGALCGYGLVMSGSRGPVVSVMVGILILIWVAIRRRKLCLVMLAIGVSLGVMMIVLVLFSGEFIANHLKLRLGVLFNEPMSDVNVAGRLQLISKGIHALTNAVQGLGVGGVSYLLTGTDAYAWLHNMPLEILLEMGLVPFLGIVLLTIAALHRLNQYCTVSRDASLLLTLFIYAISNSLVSGDFARNEAFWLFLGVSLSIEFCTRTKGYTWAGGQC